MCKGPIEHDKADDGYVVFRCENRSCEDAFKAIIRRSIRESCIRCGDPVRKMDHLPALRCLNPSCDAQIKERLTYFCGRDQMNIKSLGEAIIDKLVDLGWVRSYADIYSLSSRRADLQVMTFKHEVQGDDGPETRNVQFKEKRTNALLEAIELSKKVPLARVLAALNIRHVGASTADLLAEEFGSMGALAEAATTGSSTLESEGRGEVDDDEDSYPKKKKSKQRKKTGDDMTALFADTDDPLQAVEGIGPEVSRSLREFFGSNAGRKIWQDLRDAGVNMIQPRQKRTGPQVLAGKTMLVTGTIQGYKRNQVEDLIKRHGGTVTSSVSKKTDYLIVGDDPGSKLDKAKSLGVKTLDIDQFLQMLK